jgi:uncharacterized protein (TIGR00299 family) protein
MRALYFDCFAGASGDMIVGALIDLGLDLEELKRRLSSLELSGYTLAARKVKRRGIAATKFDVEVDESKQAKRRLAEVRALINNAALSQTVKSRSIEVFERLAQAEARVHNSTPDQVHFHEVGAVDSIIDVVGAMIGFEMLAVEHFVSSAMRLGCGWVETEHGRLPIPAPGTAELVRGAPVYAGEVQGEFVTPTGAAIITSLCKSFGQLPPMTISRIGYGAGLREVEALPNVLRLVLGELSIQTAASSIMVVETNIDDMNPQVYALVMDKALALGALDVFLTPVHMKKGRPGILLSVLCELEKLDAIIELLLSETTTLGVRYYQASRRVLDRTIETVQTEYGQVRVKVAREKERTLHFQPEYQDLLKLAEQAHVSLLEVQQAAIAAYHKLKANEERDGELEKE